MACVYSTKGKRSYTQAEGRGEQEYAGCPLLHGKAVTILIYTAISSFLGKRHTPAIFHSMTYF